MKAAVYHTAGDIRYEDVPEPGAVSSSEILIKPLWCGICGTDVHEYQAGPIVTPVDPHALTGATNPQILGHEMSAIIIEAGSEVKNVAAGQRVSIMPLLSCKQCYHCVRGRNHLCERMACIGLSYKSGGLAEFALIPAENAFPIPDSVSDLQGALVEPTAVAAYGVDSSGVRPGESLLISGAGPIGCLAALYADAAGANVIISERNPNRLRLARSLDVGQVVDVGEEIDIAEFILEQTNGVGVDAVVECSGNEAALQNAIRAVRASGTVVQTGLHTRPAAMDMMRISERDISVIGTWCFPVTDWPRIINLIDRKLSNVERVVTSKPKLDESIMDVFAELSDPKGTQTKILIQPQA
ncbi:MAG: zinc-binding dehydrogenase [Gulosibacter sp.]|uniref:zinc-binding dehydrogenase n=1 Tax=Gulosibacter sp. TaxID=2817531 RepID=UPI003F91CF39